MDNLLPRISKAAASKHSESFFSSWQVDKADPKKAVISSYLLADFTPDPEDVKRYRTNVLPKREPNYIPPEELMAVGPSPLDAKARGVPDPTGAIVLAPHNIATLNKSTYRPPKEEKIEDLVICIDCRLTSPMDVFVQRNGSIRNVNLSPGAVCLRSLTGASIHPPPGGDMLYVLATTVKRASITSTVRQEIKEFRFHTYSQIGLEVEVAFGRLVVSKVLEDTQAFPLSLHLDGAEIIAVNSKRVTDLDEFQDAMMKAKDQEVVSLLMAAYKGGRGKADDAFLFDLQKTQGMKSVLSNLFGSHGDDASNSQRIDTASTEDEESVNTRNTHSSHHTAASHHSLDEKGEEKSAKAPRVRKYNYDDTDDEEEEERSVHSAGSHHSRHSLRSAASQRSHRSLVSQHSIRFIDAKGEDLEEGSLLAAKRAPSYARLDNDAKDWNHMTTVAADDADAEAAVVVPFVTLVCMPALLKASKRWGKPQSYLQMTNFSTMYIFEVNWTDEDGSLVHRANIPAGQVHFEVCSTEHVWTLAAKPIVGKGKGHNSNASLSSNSVHNVGYDSDKPTPLLIFRPSTASLSEGKCVTMMWYPFTSVSVTQTVYPQTKKGYSNNTDRFMPCMHVQLMDPPGKQSSDSSVYADEKTLGKLLRKPLTKTRAINKWRKSKAKSGHK